MYFLILEGVVEALKQVSPAHDCLYGLCQHLPGAVQVSCKLGLIHLQLADACTRNSQYETVDREASHGAHHDHHALLCEIMLSAPSIKSDDTFLRTTWMALHVR